MNRILRVWDNGGKTLDRYTIIPARQFWRTHRDRNRMWEAVGSGPDPRGMSYSCNAVPGPHLGKRITFESLPEAVQACARHYFSELIEDTHK